MCKQGTFRNESDGIARLMPLDGTVTITMETDTFFEVVNALRDSCGCNRCESNAHFFLIHALYGKE